MRVECEDERCPECPVNSIPDALRRGVVGKLVHDTAYWLTDLEANKVRDEDLATLVAGESSIRLSSSDVSAEEIEIVVSALRQRFDGNCPRIEQPTSLLETA